MIVGFLSGLFIGTVAGVAVMSLLRRSEREGWVMTITDNLTGVVKEDYKRVKTVTDILEEVRTEMCDGYCVYPRITPNDYEKYKRICDEECPLNKL